MLLIVIPHLYSINHQYVLNRNTEFVRPILVSQFMAPQSRFYCNRIKEDTRDFDY